MNPTSTLQSALALSLLHSLWQIGVLGLLAASVLALLERRSAALRHAIGLGFLLAMALAPLATFAWLAGPNHAAGPAVAGAWSALPPAGGFDVALATTVSASAWLPWLWCVGVSVMLARLVGGWWMVRALDRQAFEPLPRPWQQRADALRCALGIRREVAIRLLHGVGLPCSARAWRPVVWLPVSMLTRLDPDQIEALIAHELAHIRRLDWIWNGVQCAIEALLFYHPGMWWLSRRIRAERENACDDLAVAVCGDAIVLAEALATLERHRNPAHVLALSATGGALMHRIKRLLSSDHHADQPAPQPARMRWAVPVGVMAVVCSGALLAAQLQPGSAPVAAKSQPVAQVAPAIPVQSAKPVRPAITARVGSDGQSFRLSESRLVDGDRSYRASVDAAGKVTETYTVDGKPARIDADAREWITRMQVAAMIAPPAPPPPPLPPMPTMPPLPPAPPAPPSLTSTAAYRAALQGAQQDAGVIALVGAPVRGGAVAADSRLTDDSADLLFEVSGPKGSAHVRVRGDLEAGVWDIATLNLQGH